MIALSINGLILTGNDLIVVGKAAWTNRRGDILAVTDLYDTDDPTDEVEDLIVPPGMTAFIAGQIVNPKDLETIRDFVTRR